MRRRKFYHLFNVFLGVATCIVVIYIIHFMFLHSRAENKGRELGLDNGAIHFRMPRNPHTRPDDVRANGRSDISPLKSQREEGSKNVGGEVKQQLEEDLTIVGRKIKPSQERDLKYEAVKRELKQNTISRDLPAHAKASQKKGLAGAAAVVKTPKTHRKKGHRQAPKRKNKIKPCPDKPPNLVGDFPCQCQPVSIDAMKSKHPSVEPGGRIRPKNCWAQQRVALIIPYQEYRHTHLHVLLANLLPILIKQEVDVTIFVVEQLQPNLMNMGSLGNIGFIESSKVGSFDCYIFQEVDMIPRNDRVIYRCADNPRHFVASKNNSADYYHPAYSDYFGGVISLTKEHFQLVNGYSNLYFGWGGVDDDFIKRIQNKQLKPFHVDENVGHYQKLHRPGQEEVVPNPRRFQLLKTAIQRQIEEGLKTTRYKLISSVREPLFTRITVALDMEETLKTTPNSTLSDLSKSSDKH